MQKTEAITLVIIALIVTVTQVVMIGLAFLYPIWFLEMYPLIGLFMAPICAGIISAVLVGITIIFYQVKWHLIIPMMLLSMSLTYVLYQGSVNSDHISNYFQKLNRGRLDYSQAIKIRYYNHDVPLIAEKMKNGLPKEWRLEGISYDDKQKVYWFTALKNSFVHGSVRYVGVLREEESKIIDIVSIDQLWEEIKRVKGLPVNENYRYSFTAIRDLRIEYTRFNSSNYYLYLTVDEGKIILKDER